MVSYTIDASVKNKVIEKLHGIIKQGHTPKRSFDHYEDSVELANCFEHAVFNLSNEQLENNFDFFEANVFRAFIPSKEGLNEIFRFIGQTGLIIQKCEPKALLKNNEWKVSLFQRKASFRKTADFHWFLQEKDGSWSDKLGSYSEVTRHKKLHSRYHSYKILGYYKITNPYLSKSNEIDKEL